MIKILLITVSILICINFLLLRFSCNTNKKVTPKPIAINKITIAENNVSKTAPIRSKKKPTKKLADVDFAATGS